MRHLSDETLARLVDDQPTHEERKHLDGCGDCTAALDELREQTLALAALPELRPPADEWEALEERLVAEGLVSDLPAASGGASTAPSFRTGWLQTAAAVILFLGGTGFGTWMAGQETEETSGPAQVETERGETVTLPEIASAEDAAAYVQSAEEAYVDALLTYRDLLGDSDGASATSDPATRVAALEALVAASQAAIQQAPADPFFNGVLASAMAERQAAIRQISFASNDTWY